MARIGLYGNTQSDYDAFNRLADKYAYKEESDRRRQEAQYLQAYRIMLREQLARERFAFQVRNMLERRALMEQRAAEMDARRRAIEERRNPTGPRELSPEARQTYAQRLSQKGAYPIDIPNLIDAFEKRQHEYIPEQYRSAFEEPKAKKRTIEETQRMSVEGIVEAMGMSPMAAKTKVKMWEEAGLNPYYFTREQIQKLLALDPESQKTLDLPGLMKVFEEDRAFREGRRQPEPQRYAIHAQTGAAIPYNQRFPFEQQPAYELGAGSKIPEGQEPMARFAQPITGGPTRKGPIPQRPLENLQELIARYSYVPGLGRSTGRIDEFGRPLDEMGWPLSEKGVHLPAEGQMKETLQAMNEYGRGVQGMQQPIANVFGYPPTGAGPMQGGYEYIPPEEPNWMQSAPNWLQGVVNYLLRGG